MRDLLLRSIIAEPGEDSARLVFADWLDERGESVHAQLIRVQCELENVDYYGARGIALRKEEKRLLSDRAFHFTSVEPLPFTYSRGFIDDTCTLTYSHPRFVLEVLSHDLKGQFVELQAADMGVLDKMLGLKLDLNWHGTKFTHSTIDQPLFKQILRRVVYLSSYDSSVTPELVQSLASSQDLCLLDGVSIDKAGVVPLCAIAELFHSASIPEFSYLRLDGEDWVWQGTSAWQEDNGPIVDFVRNVAPSPKLSQLQEVFLGCSVGNKIAEALLACDNLAPRDIQLFAAKKLSKAQRKALKEKFGKSLLLK